jgi:hypothetical protein
MMRNNSEDDLRASAAVSAYVGVDHAARMKYEARDLIMNE